MVLDLNYLGCHDEDAVQAHFPSRPAWKENHRLFFFVCRTVGATVVVGKSAVRFPGNKLIILCCLFTPPSRNAFDSQVVGKRRQKLPGSLEAFGKFFLPDCSSKVHKPVLHDGRIFNQFRRPPREPGFINNRH